MGFPLHFIRQDIRSTLLIYTYKEAAPGTTCLYLQKQRKVGVENRDGEDGRSGGRQLNKITTLPVVWLTFRTLWARRERKEVQQKSLAFRITSDFYTAQLQVSSTHIFVPKPEPRACQQTQALRNTNFPFAVYGTVALVRGGFFFSLEIFGF